MLNIHLHGKSLKISWTFKGTIDSNMFKLMNSFLPESLPFKANIGEDYFSQIASEITNPFWQDVFSAYSNLQAITRVNIPCQPLWKNRLIRINNMSIYYKSWYKKGVVFINDLLDNKGNCLTLESFKLKWEINVNFLQYFGICEAIKCRYNRPADLLKVDQPLRPDSISLV